jgi:hypothetical protein
MEDKTQRRLLNGLLMILVGIPSLIACVLGGVSLLGVLFFEPDLSEILSAIPFFLGGLAGLWGSQTLSMDPAERSSLAKIASACGVIAFVVLMSLMLA